MRGIDVLRRAAVVGLMLGAMGRVWGEGVVDPKRPEVMEELNVKYGPAAGVSNLLDVYWPVEAKGALPLIVWVHGGGWIGGDKAGCPAVPAVVRGYVVASVNYRFSDKAKFPAQIEDCKGAIRFLKAHAAAYHIDKEKVGVWGDSAGGHLVALLGTSGGVKSEEGTVGGNLDQTSEVQAVCDWYGPTDMSKLFAEAGPDNIFLAHPEKSPIAGLFGGMPADHAELVQRANPIAFVTALCPPFLIMHGDQDRLVPLAQSEDLKAALDAVKVPCELVVLKGEGHGSPGFRKKESLEKVAGFFDGVLKGEGK